MLSTVVVIDTTLPSASRITMCVVPLRLEGLIAGAGRGSRRHTRMRRRGGDTIADLRRARLHVVCIEHAIYGHGHERRVAVVEIAIGVHEAFGFTQLHPGDGIVGAAVADVGITQQHQSLQHADAAGGQWRSTHHVHTPRAAQRRGSSIGL